MARPKSKRGKEIREFILASVPDHPHDLVRVVVEEFSISRQAAGRHVAELVVDGSLEAVGARRQRSYSLRLLVKRELTLSLAGLEEHVVWRDQLSDAFKGFPENVVAMWNYGCSEMVNNAIDHSSGRSLMVALDRNARAVQVTILDDGVGIFRKIKEACNLEDERHAVLELAKGKLTTAPQSHTGEGIFFTSRIMDEFVIISGGVVFSHEHGKEEDWIFEREIPREGTAVFMKLASDSKRTIKQVMDDFASDENDYGFTKTVVPVRMVREGAESLVSRSQAKRLLSRLDRFRTVLLDFEGVESIGRPFADEIFRVFTNAHPNVLVLPINVNEEITNAISGVTTNRD